MSSSPRVFRGLLLSVAATASSVTGAVFGQVGSFREVLPSETVARCSFVPRCQGLCGSPEIDLRAGGYEMRELGRVRRLDALGPR